MRPSPAGLAATVVAVLAVVAPHDLRAQPLTTPAVSVPRVMTIAGVFQPADCQPPRPVETITLALYADPVGTNDDGYKAIDYSKLPLLTIQAVKELKAENDALKAQTDDLKARLEEVERIIGEIRATATVR